MSSTAPKMLRTQALDTSMLSTLAADPSNMVYTFAYDTPEATMSSRTQIQQLESIVVNFDAFARAHPEETAETLRERVLALSGPHFQHRLFQRLYSKTFALITQRVYDADDEERLDKIRKGVLFALRNKDVAGDSMSYDALTAGVMQQMTRLAMHPATEADASTAQRVPMEGDGLPDVEGAERIPDVQPMNRMELGESMVRQRRAE